MPAAESVAGGSIAAGAPVGGGPVSRRRWRRATTLAVTALLAAAAVIVLVAQRASYQPLGYGGIGVSTLDYPGLPAAIGARTVNTFGFVREDVYIPPQRKGYTFYLFADIANDGSRSVTIESVGLPPDSALTPAGPARYAPHPSGGDGAPGIPPASTVLHQATLRPGGALLVAIPVRSWPCFPKDFGFVTVPTFNVTYRSLYFTHTTALPWGSRNDELILHSPAGRPGQDGIVCITNR